MAWIIAYDITCPRRWRRFYRLVREYGVRLQWSVFLVTQAPFHRAQFLSAAAKLIDPKADDVRLYQVISRDGAEGAGTPIPRLPTGVHWRGLKSKAPRAS
jgi:CRISPR-associated protein Cas2